jgi:hypothetical protein
MAAFGPEAAVKHGHLLEDSEKIIRFPNGSVPYYAGIALDVEHRFFRHVFGLGAKFTRARPPVRVLAADALRAEFALLQPALIRQPRP